MKTEGTTSSGVVGYFSSFKSAIVQWKLPVITEKDNDLLVSIPHIFLTSFSRNDECAPSSPICRLFPREI